MKGQTIEIKKGSLKGQIIKIEDFWHIVGGKSWRDMFMNNPACLNYFIRKSKENLPADDEVYYGKIGSFGYLVHISELL